MGGMGCLAHRPPIRCPCLAMVGGRCHCHRRIGWHVGTRHGGHLMDTTVMHETTTIEDLLPVIIAIQFFVAGWLAGRMRIWGRPAPIKRDRSWRAKGEKRTQ